MSYDYRSSYPPDSSGDYLMPVVMKILESFPPPRAIFELGCGNGSNAKRLATHGYSMTAVDPSESGIAFAQDETSRFEVGSAYDDLAKRYGLFDIVLSLEVVEHLYDPRRFARTVRDLLNPGGVAIISTPYHGYLKNLALALSGKTDLHHDPLWDGGHIKFWNRKSLGRLFREVGMEEEEFARVGRLPPIAKSMVVSFRRKPLF